MNGCLQYDPMKRFDIDQFINHPFVNKEAQDSLIELAPTSFEGEAQVKGGLSLRDIMNGGDPAKQKKKGNGVKLNARDNANLQRIIERSKLVH